MKQLGSIENKANKDKSDENVPHVESTAVLLVHLISSTMIINKIQDFCIHLLQINHMVIYETFH